jgi:predicted AAA+ superfamily ATPase
MNMFWEKEKWEESDKHLVELQRSPFQRKLPPLEIDEGLTIIRGPRQVGKSTWLKLLLKEHLGKGSKCFFYSCEDLEDYKDLLALLEPHIEDRIVFLDEITFVDQWWRAIKKIIDSRLGVKIVVTGSNAFDLRKGLDFMPGRMAKSSGEIYLLPMLYQEWLEARKQAGWKTLSHVEGIRAFMRIGGFPMAVAEAGEQADVPQQARQVYQRWLRGDVVKLNRQELYMKELMGRLAKTMTSALSLQGIAKETQLMSYHTAQDYIAILEQAFALRVLYAYNPEKDAFHVKKARKFYFTDPMVYWVALEWAGMKTPENYEDQIAELLASEFLHRSYSRLGFYSSAQGEIDFMQKRDFALEVKWSEKSHNLSKAFKNLRIPNKKVWYKTNFFEPIN